MRGRKPIRPVLTPADVRFLHEITASPFWPTFAVDRAKTLLLLAAGERVQDIALKLRCALATVAQRRRHFQRKGIVGVVTMPPKTGRPRGVREAGQLPVEMNAV